jgi:hypothetical protein
MHVRAGLLGAAGLALLSMTVLAPAAPSGAAAPRPAGPAHLPGGLGVMIPAHPGEVLGVANTTSDSLNWSGYAVLPTAGQSITAVNSTFVVPTVNGTTPGFAATWAGIGGYNTSDLIQAGVGEQYVPGLGASYNAWYEILPASETALTGCTGDANCTVRPGDTVTVSIHDGGTDTWTVSLADTGHCTFTKTLAYQSTHSSAEWILEAPTVGAQTVMPAMSNSLFDPGNTYTVGSGSAQAFGTGSPVTLTMNTLEGIPSPIDADGDGFNGCTYALTCPAPAS